MNKTIFDYEDAALAQFDLQGFFPYQVRVFYTEVSSAVAEIYQEKQDMSAAEWRCLAILNAGGKMTAADIVLASSMDKVTVSRAVSKLRTKEWIIEKSNRQDGRSKVIKLSASGKSVLRDLVPKTLEMEAQLLEGITQEQLSQFHETMAKISENRAKLLRKSTSRV